MVPDITPEVIVEDYEFSMFRNATLRERLAAGYHGVVHPVYCPKDSSRLRPTGQIVVRGLVHDEETGAYQGTKLAQGACNKCEYGGAIVGRDVSGVDFRLQKNPFLSALIIGGYRLNVNASVSRLGIDEFLATIDRSLVNLLPVPENYRNKPTNA